MNAFLQPKTVLAEKQRSADLFPTILGHIFAGQLLLLGHEEGQGHQAAPDLVLEPDTANRIRIIVADTLLMKVEVRKMICASCARSEVDD